MSTLESQSNEVQLDLRVAVFDRPQVQRGSGDFVNHRLGVSCARPVDVLEIAFARFTRLDSHVAERRRVVACELRRFLFSAMRADCAPERPERNTFRAHQIAVATFCACLLVLQNAQLRFFLCTEDIAIQKCAVPSVVAVKLRRCTDRMVAGTLSRKTPCRKVRTNTTTTGHPSRQALRS